MKNQIFTDFLELVVKLSKRPGMYVGANRVVLARAYLEGYAHGKGVYLCQNFQGWLQSKYGINHPAWHCSRILLHAFGSDEVVFEHLPQLMEEFLEELDTVGLEEFTRRHGDTPHGEPLDTRTTYESNWRAE